MKLTKKIVLIILIIFMTILCMSSYIYASDSIDSAVSDGDDFINRADQVAINTQEMKDFSNVLYTVCFILGVVIAVIIGLVIGIKFMISSAEGKAEQKKKLIAYFIGCAVLFGGFTIWKITIVALDQIQVDNVAANNDPTVERPSFSSESSTSKPSTTAPNRTQLTNKRIELNETYLTVNMDEKESITLIATVLPEQYSEEKVVWSSSDKTIATVNKNGVVKFKKDGTVTIRASLESDPEVYRDCIIIVKSAEVQRLNLNRTILMLDDRHYKIAYLECTVKPSNLKTKITWSSSNTDIVKVNRKRKGDSCR